MPLWLLLGIPAALAGFFIYEKIRGSTSGAGATGTPGCPVGAQDSGLNYILVNGCITVPPTTMTAGSIGVGTADSGGAQSSVTNVTSSNPSVAAAAPGLVGAGGWGAINLLAPGQATLTVNWTSASGAAGKTTINLTVTAGPPPANISGEGWTIPGVTNLGSFLGGLIGGGGDSQGATYTIDETQANPQAAQAMNVGETLAVVLPSTAYGGLVDNTSVLAEGFQQPNPDGTVTIIFTAGAAGTANITFESFDSAGNTVPYGQPIAVTVSGTSGGFL